MNKNCYKLQVSRGSNSILLYLYGYLKPTKCHSCPKVLPRKKIQIIKMIPKKDCYMKVG